MSYVITFDIWQSLYYELLSVIFKYEFKSKKKIDLRKIKKKKKGL